MEENVLILRPISDAFREIGTGIHLPEAGSLAYILVSEEVADNESTYISASGGMGINGVAAEAEYAFNLTSIKIPKNQIIKSITFKLTCCAAGASSCSITPGIILDDSKFSATSINRQVYFPDEDDMTSEYKMYSTQLSENDIKSINELSKNDKDKLNLLLYVRMEVSVASEYKMSGIVYLTQIYVEIAFEGVKHIGIFDKVNTTYKAATVAFKKQDGVWTEIADTECKEILKNNTIRRG